MKVKRWGMIFIFVLVASALMVSLVAAEDGLLFRQQYLQDAGAGNREGCHFYDGLLCAGAGLDGSGWPGG